MSLHIPILSGISTKLGQIKAALSGISELLSVSSTYRFITTASTNATLVKDSEGSAKGLIVNNNSVADIYVKFYDSDVAPVVGTDTPILVLEIPSSTYQYLDLHNLGFSQGISLATVNAIADDETGGVASGIHITLIYK